MATSMSSMFTAPERRKKAVTYGKSSRLPSIPAPIPAASSDAPSPERPRKQIAQANGSLKRNGGLPKASGALGTTRATTGSPDIFDVPSEDEFVAYPVKATKKLPTKQGISENDAASRTPNSKIDTTRQPSKATQPVPRADVIKPTAPKLQKPLPPAKIDSIQPLSSSTSATRLSRRGKTPQPTEEGKLEHGNRDKEQRSIAKAKVVPHTTAAEPTVKPTKTTKPARSLRDVPAKAVRKPPADVDIFDVPSSDDEANMPTPKPPRRAPTIPRSETAKPTTSSSESRQRESAESEDSEAMKKRKRKGSFALSAIARPVLEKKDGTSLPQRSRKYQKIEDSVSPGHDPVQVPTTSTSPDPEPPLAAINKPRRTRVRTVPVLAQPAITKGQSSPARLHGMLPGRNVPKHSPIAEAPEITTLEDETMYEIPESLSTPVRQPSNSAGGSVTPRQKALFGSLLGSSSSSNTPMPSISRLQLTDRKPPSLLGTLSRSSFDLTHSAPPKKTRLIASLKPIKSSSEAEDSGSDSGSSSEQGVEQTTADRRIRDNKSNKVLKSRRALDEISDDMEVDIEEAVDSQTSQAASGFGSRSKFTYAKSRSYLQEENPEDALLMSMDLDAPITFGSQSKDSQTEEEEEASQVRPNHELKRQGHNTKFQWENQMLIDDMAPKSNNAIRRSALLELCTKMADETFTHNLLESSLTDQFFANIASNGEIIFDFAAVVATIFMLRSNPSYTTFEQVHRSELKVALDKLLNNDTDISKVSKNRKTNLSKMAQEAVVTFRSVVLASPVWPSLKPEILSPRMVALKALDILVTGLRDTNASESVLSPKTVGSLIDIAASTSKRCKNVGPTTEDRLILSLTFSILEAVSLLKQKQTLWSGTMLRSLADSMAVIFRGGDASTIMLVVKLCMNLTNNKPKACQHFSDSTFVQPLVWSIVERTQLLLTDIEEAQRAEALDTLILSLGAMINLTEHIDQARNNVDDGERLVETLVQTFVEGSGRTALAVSMEESKSSVAVGYLSVLLGNMCLNSAVKSKIRAHLPNQRLTTLTDKIKEFVRVHEHVNRKAKQFEGDEGQETWQNYTARIMHVVNQLEKAGC